MTAKPDLFPSPKAGDMVAIYYGGAPIPNDKRPIERVTPRQIVVGGEHYYRGDGWKVRVPSSMRVRPWTAAIDDQIAQHKRDEEDRAKIKALANRLLTIGDTAAHAGLVMKPCADRGGILAEMAAIVDEAASKLSELSALLIDGGMPASKWSSSAKTFIPWSSAASE